MFWRANRAFFTDFVGDLHELGCCPRDEHHIEAFLGHFHGVRFANAIGCTGYYCEKMKYVLIRYRYREHIIENIYITETISLAESNLNKMVDNDISLRYRLENQCLLSYSLTLTEVNSGLDYDRNTISTLIV